MVEKAITADRDQPYLVPKLSVIVDAYLEGVRMHPSKAMKHCVQDYSIASALRQA